MKIRAGLIFVLTFIFMNWSYACVSIYAMYDCPSSDQWPTTHPSSAVSTIFTNTTRSTGRVYAWRKDGYIWLEVIPLSEGFFVGIDSFEIIQEGNKHYLELLTAPEILQYGYIEKSIILLLDPKQPPNFAKLNIQEDFTLKGLFGIDSDSLDVPASATADGSSNDEPDVVDCSVLPYYANGVVYIPCTHVPNGNGGTDIYQTSWTIIPDREPLSLELHSIETFDAE